MKKILSILCVLALLMTMSVVAFAAEEVDEGDILVATDETDTETTGDVDVVVAEPEMPEIPVEEIGEAVEKAVNDIVAGVNNLLDKAGVPSAEDVSNIICEKIKNDTGVDLDLSEVKAALAAKGIDLASIKVVTAGSMDDIMQAAFDIIGEKYGQDKVDAIYDILKNSKVVNAFAKLYVKTPETTEVPETEEETTAEEVTEVPEVVPKTGDASIIAGVAVLAVAAAAAVVCTKKAKKDEE